LPSCSFRRLRAALSHGFCRVRRNLFGLRPPQAPRTSPAPCVFDRSRRSSLPFNLRSRRVAHDRVNLSDFGPRAMPPLERP
jgi:hypothetical protein